MIKIKYFLLDKNSEATDIIIHHDNNLHFICRDKSEVKVAF